MSETTEDIQDGIICQVCGVWMPDMFEDDPDKTPSGLWGDPPGHPRTCEDCKKD